MSLNYYRAIRKNLFGLADKVMKTNVMGWLQHIESMQGWSKEEIREWQDSKLKKLIYHAYNNTDYYRSLFNDIGLKPEDIERRSDLSKIPILTRELINENFEKMMPKNGVVYPHQKKRTGGTTNRPMTYLLDNNSWSFVNANYIFNWEKAGYNFGDKYIALGSSSILAGNSIPLKNQLYYLLKNRLSLNGILMNDEICAKYIDIISKQKIKFIYGYASSLYMLSKYCLDNNVILNLTACFSTSEVLTDLYKEKIVKAFNCSIINCYGANDGGITAFEHSKDKFQIGYNVIYEINSLESISPGTGPILTTDLLNYAMPMINYQIGDIVTLSNSDCDYNGDCFTTIVGRTSDVIKLENGNTFTSTGFYGKLFKKVPVSGYKFSKGGHNELLCEIQVKTEFRDEHEVFIRNTLKSYSGENSSIKLIRVDKFNDTRSGKMGHIVVE